MKVLDLFSGIGGFSLGLERAGMKTVAFCEIEEFPRKVLAKHWPNVPIYDDVRTLTRERLESDGISGIDVICGGFPCQDISLAGKGAGLAGERSGLWSEFARLIGEIRPRHAIVENVAALLGRGLGDVLGDLAALGYDAEWHCIPASHVGAPHRRDRLWIVANAGSVGREGQCEVGAERRTVDGDSREPSALGAVSMLRGLHLCQPLAFTRARMFVSTCRGVDRWVEYGALFGGEQWPPAPAPIRVANGIPNRVDRLAALGNSVVPQIVERLGRAILEAA